MKRFLQCLICFLLIWAFSVQLLEAISIEGSRRTYKIPWYIPCYDAIEGLYPLEKLAIELKPYFIADSVKLDVDIPAITLSGSDIDRQFSSVMINLEVEVPYKKDWSLNVAATVSHGENILISDTLVLDLSIEFSDPIQFIDTTVIDFPVWKYMPDEMCEKVRESSLRNRVVMDLCNNQRDNVLLEGLQLLPYDEALTYYLKALRLAYRERFNEEFNRQDDPNLCLPRDSVDLADSITISSLEAQIDTLRSFIELDKFIGLDCSDLESQLNSKLSILRELEQGRPIVYYARYTRYEVLSEYLSRCFQKDSSFVKIAMREPSIPREVLKEILREKYVDIYHPYETYICPKIEKRAYRLKLLREKEKYHQIEDRYMELLRQDITSLAAILESDYLESKQSHEELIVNVEWFYASISESIEYYGQENLISPSKLKTLRRELDKKAKYLRKL